MQKQKGKNDRKAFEKRDWNYSYEKRRRLENEIFKTINRILKMAPDT